MKPAAPQKEQGRPSQGTGPARAHGRKAHTAIPRSAAQAANAGPVQVTKLAVAEIGRSPWNRDEFDAVRLDELVASIAERGIIQPIVVRENPGYTAEQTAPGAWRVVSKEGTEVAGGLAQNEAEVLCRRLNATLWEIIAGERRWRAAERLILHDVPAIVRKASDRETLELQASENLQREDLNPIHEAQKYQQLITAHRAAGANGEAVELVAQHIGRSRAHVYEKLKLLCLPAATRSAVVTGRLPASHAALLTRIDDPEIQAEITDRILKPKHYEVDENESDALLAQSLTTMSFRRGEPRREQSKIMNTKPTSKQPAGRRWLDRLVSWVPRSAEGWKILGLLIGMILIVVAAIGGPILMGILKLWALFKYVFS